jgi:hypothetical protein
MRWLAPLLLIAGCDQVFQIEPTKLAGGKGDSDGDGIDDTVDNCVHKPNPDQSDLDGDQVGDACDDCPLVIDRDQVDTDLDGVGDVCDPHPLTTGDCLAFLDTFSDASMFADHWTVDPNGSSAVTPTADGVQIFSFPQAFASAAIVSRDLPPGDYAVQAMGTLVYVESDGPLVFAGTLSGVALGQIGYGCQLRGQTNLPLPSAEAVWGAGSFGQTFFDDPISPQILLRSVPPETDHLAVRCRVDFGVAVGVEEDSSANPVTPAPPGVLVTAAAMHLRGIAAYTSGGGACAPAIVH